MKLSSGGKPTRLLPTRGGLNDLTKRTSMSINDYSKAVPGSVTAPSPSIINNLRSPKLP